VVVTVVDEVASLLFRRFPGLHREPHRERGNLFPRCPLIGGIHETKHR